MQTIPFKRAHAFLNAMNAIMLSGIPQYLQRIELDNLGAYRSRGHGKNINVKKPKINFTTNWKQRMGGQTCGQRECARRVKQLNAMGK